MPKIKLEKVVTFSSEEPHFPASNILDPDPSKKWKCAKIGEKNAIVVLQLEKATHITGIDLGNEHSAFIEILVSRSSNDLDDFKPFLTMSTFMSPMEARQSQNVNKVRMFTTNDFAKPECNEKWDRLKIICSQPYNKHIQYGLSFIAIHSSENVDNTSTKKNVGKFTLRPDSPELKVGSLFSQHKKNAESPVLKGVAAIREASNNPVASSYKSPIGPKPTIKRTNNGTDDPIACTSDRNRDDLLYTKDDDAPNSKIDEIIEKKRKEDEQKKQMEEQKKAELEKKKNAQTESKKPSPTKPITKKRRSEDENEENASPKKKLKPTETQDASTSSNSSTPKRKNITNDSPNKKMKKDTPYVLRKPFNKLLEDVTFVISGIQNPDRANLRATALSMGAKYKADWDRSCTHLICAFMNTPKFNQVKGRGKIVTKRWIEECDVQRSRIPWRRYALDRNDKTGDESEEEIFEEVDNDQEQGNELGASDTDEELDRIQMTIKKSPTRKPTLKIDDSDDDETNKKEITMKSPPITEASTSQDQTVHKLNGKNINELPTLPDYFQEKHFYLNPSLGDLKKQLIQYIVAYNGTILEDLDEKRKTSIIVITSFEDVEEMKNIKTPNEISYYVSPVWIWECHNKKQLVPMDEYSFV